MSDESLGYRLVVRMRVSREEWVRRVYEHARELSRILGERVLVNEKVLKAELEKWEKEGLPWCVCRFERTPREVCPCSYHVDELRRYGRCKCGLFWTERACNEFRKKIKKDVSFCV